MCVNFNQSKSVLMIVNKNEIKHKWNDFPSDVFSEKFQLYC